MFSPPLAGGGPVLKRQWCVFQEHNTHRQQPGQASRAFRHFMPYETLITLPGFMMFWGSSVRLIARMTSSATSDL